MLSNKKKVVFLQPISREKSPLKWNAAFVQWSRTTASHAVDHQFDSGMRYRSSLKMAAFCCFYVGNLYLLRPDFPLQGVQAFCWIPQTMLIAISASTLSKQLLDTIKRYFILLNTMYANIGIIGYKHLKFGSHRAETY